MNVACDYEAPMQMLTTEKYIAARAWGGATQIVVLYTCMTRGFQNIP